MSQKEPFTWRRATTKQAPPASAPASATQTVATPPSPKAAPSVSRHIAERGPSAPASTQSPSSAPNINTNASTPPAPAHEEIAIRAHALWEGHGCPQGEDRQHWLQAERELKAEAR